MSAIDEISRKFQIAREISRKKAARQMAEIALELSNYCSARVRLERMKATLQRHRELPISGDLSAWIATSLVLDHGKPELKAQMLSGNIKAIQRVIDAVLYDGGIEASNGYWLEVVE